MNDSVYNAVRNPKSSLTPTIRPRQWKEMHACLCHHTARFDWETAANLHEIGVTMSAHDDGVTPLITNVESPPTILCPS